MTMAAHTRYALADHPNRTKADAWIAARIAAGWHWSAIAAAANVSERTAKRWIADFVRVEEITVDGWTARYAIRATKPPLRLEAWHR